MVIIDVAIQTDMKWHPDATLNQNQPLNVEMLKMGIFPNSTACESKFS
jgi:hypothetical protein